MQRRIFCDLLFEPCKCADRLHGGSGVSTAFQHQEGSWFESLFEALLCGACMFFSELTLGVDVNSTGLVV